MKREIQLCDNCERYKSRQIGTFKDYDLLTISLFYGTNQRKYFDLCKECVVGFFNWEEITNPNLRKDLNYIYKLVAKVNLSKPKKSIEEEYLGKLTGDKK